MSLIKAVLFVCVGVILLPADTLASASGDAGARIVALSETFLGTPYAENTLVGGPAHPEQLVTDRSRLDCFTFLDVVEALRRSIQEDEFVTQLRQVRYRDGLVDYGHRRHFFSDWVSEPGSPLVDVSRAVGQGRTVESVKHLNRRRDGSLWLPGINVVERKVEYIPTGKIDDLVLAALRSGDYLGVYSDSDGLDVSHTGIVVKERGRVLLRHASSRAEVRRVVDETLVDYLAGKPGIVVYRVH